MSRERTFNFTDEETATLLEWFADHDGAIRRAALELDGYRCTNPLCIALVLRLRQDEPTLLGHTLAQWEAMSLEPDDRERVRSVFAEPALAGPAFEPLVHALYKARYSG